MWHCLTAGCGLVEQLDSGWWKSVRQAPFKLCVFARPLFHLAALRTSTSCSGRTPPRPRRTHVLDKSMFRDPRGGGGGVPGDYANPLMRESMMCCLAVFILSEVKSLTTQEPLTACFDLSRRRETQASSYTPTPAVFWCPLMKDGERVKRMIVPLSCQKRLLSL